LGDEFEETDESANDEGCKFEKFGAVVKALYDMANNVAATGDMVDKASQKLGLSAEAYQEWDYVLSQCGANIDSLGMGMKILQNTLSGLTEDGDKSSGAFARIGINFHDIKDKLPEEAFDMTVKALQATPPGAEKTAAAMKLLGEQGMELMPLLNANADEIDGLKEKARDLGVVMSEDAVAASMEYTDSVDTLKRSFAGIKNSIGADRLPCMTMITDAFTGFLAGQDGVAGV